MGSLLSILQLVLSNALLRGISPQSVVTQLFPPAPELKLKGGRGGGDENGDGKGDGVGDGDEDGDGEGLGDLGDLSGKVYLITGANTGIGYHLASTLYSHHAHVYLACRSSERAEAAIASIISQHQQQQREAAMHDAPADDAPAPSASRGRLSYVHCDLADLASVRACARTLRARETRLDVLFNNAGVMSSRGEDAGHGDGNGDGNGDGDGDEGRGDGDERHRHPSGAAEREVHLATNCLGPFLLTRLLMPILQATARAERERSAVEEQLINASSSAATADHGPAAAAVRKHPVRVVWVASSATEGLSPYHGVDMRDLTWKSGAQANSTGSSWSFLFGSATTRHAYHRKHWLERYGTSKAGNYLQAAEFNRRYGPWARKHFPQGDQAQNVETLHGGDNTLDHDLNHNHDDDDDDDDPAPVLSIACNPGNLRSDLWRERSSLETRLLTATLLHPAWLGACTELFAAFGDLGRLEREPDLWVIPWGRLMQIRRDIYEATIPRSEGGPGVARDFWAWCERATAL